MNKAIEQKLARACQYIEATEEPPTLTCVAQHVALSPSHFQKVFKKALGISPRDYADAVRFQRLRKKLKTNQTISGAIYEAGFGASSRLYEFANRYLGMTPKNYQKKGEGISMVYTIVNSPLGYLLVAATPKGICSVKLGDDKKILEAELKKEFAAAELKSQNSLLRQWTQALIDYLAGHKPLPTLPSDIQATAFQRRVWNWLMTIPSGKTYHYEEVARAIGKPSACRAVARACAANPIALIIPCHRIVPKAGGLGGYRWLVKRKKYLLDLEKAHYGKFKSPS